ncbi:MULTISPECIES: 5'/3'-nucleotidase SurE [Acidiplasma]|jgi:5'-nucleotidase|uniref:5'-nucleotidase SurE n=2 Tax=Acidiplasma TaxID=507753 RepID=A0A0N8VL38_9ARCH|nr:MULTISPECIES: 5'/3'-nucleotidase SurE [Acidiplasma]KQB35444.1 hypothetical protein AOG55_06750 [Acidiplasma cupricumulans]KQB36446.1 hypothetical protein AOG54_07400 [Acidiplasma aeolicum]WMT55407.1 MAG: 5'/3'-nucleotidase SurE [Acidiplasma sp.]
MILVTNDDGYFSRGIKTLYMNAAKISTGAVMVAPDRPRSASGMSITFNNPLRAKTIDENGINGYAISGFPADTIFLARNALYRNEKIDLIASGINHGLNISLRSLYTSGTISAAMTGALLGIKGIAFSIDVNEENEKSADFEKAGIIARHVMEYVINKGFPKDVDILNINFPHKINDGIKMVGVPMYVNAFSDYVREDEDPHGNKYYWFWNKFSDDYDENTDYYTVMHEENISVTPLSVHGHVITNFSGIKSLCNDVSGLIYNDEYLSDVK